MLSCALSVYCTSSDLCGTSCASSAHSYGLNTSGPGTCGDNYSVGNYGSAFGVANNTKIPVLQLLTHLNANTNCGAAVSSGASTVFSGINTSGNVANALSSDGTAYSPAQILGAYGINQLSLDGTGQTIAIVDAYDDPNIGASVDAFDSQFGQTTSGPTLFDQYGPASSFLTVMGQDGSTNLPSTDPSGAGTANWEVEEALDVEWVHATAPGAQIILVEANSQSLSDLMASVATAASQPGVSVVSMSWGFAEGQSVLAADEAQYDADLTTPAGHQGVTFVASTGDYGTADPEYPAFSPNVVAVGGTSLSLNADNSYQSEAGWGSYNSGIGAFTGGGGGASLYEAEPTFQLGVQNTGYRTTPDVSFDADPNTGVWIADSYNLTGSTPFEVVGGTSVSAPAWAGLIALANEGRTLAGESTLGSATDPTATQEALYSVPATDYNAVSTGFNGFNANAGYNLVTGLGTPQANLLVSDLVAYQGPINFAANSGNVTVTPATIANAPGLGSGGDIANILANALVFDAEIASDSTAAVPMLAPRHLALGPVTTPTVSPALDQRGIVALSVPSSAGPAAEPATVTSSPLSAFVAANVSSVEWSVAPAKGTLAPAIRTSGASTSPTISEEVRPGIAARALAAAFIERWSLVPVAFNAGVISADPSVDHAPTTFAAAPLMDRSSLENSGASGDSFLWRDLGDAVFADDFNLFDTDGWHGNPSALLVPLAGLAGLGLMVQTQAVDEEEEKLDRRQRPQVPGR